MDGYEELSGAVRYLGSEDEPRVDLPKALDTFWTEEVERMRYLSASSENDFKQTNDLPLARIKRIMKSDEDVRMISAEAPVLFAKACELFILELTIRSVAQAAASDDAHSSNAGKATRSLGPAVSTGRRTLAREDVLLAIQRTDIFDFLVSVLLPGMKPQYLIDAEAEGIPTSEIANSIFSGVQNALPPIRPASRSTAKRGGRKTKRGKIDDEDEDDFYDDRVNLSGGDTQETAPAQTSRRPQRINAGLRRKQVIEAEQDDYDFE